MWSLLEIIDFYWFSFTKNKLKLLPSIRRLSELGYKIFATAGIADFTKEHGNPVQYLKIVNDDETQRYEFSLNHLAKFGWFVHQLTSFQRLQNSLNVVAGVEVNGIWDDELSDIVGVVGDYIINIEESRNHEVEDWVHVRMS